MKRKLAVGGVVLAAVALITVGTLAYLVSEGRATNTITTGTVEIELKEYSVYTPAANPEDPVPGDAIESENVLYTDPDKVVPGDEVDKIPVITNTGTADCWVRMQVTLIPPEQDLVQRGAQQSGLAALIDMDYDEVNWTLEGDWYYYKESLAPGEAAPPLFTQVSLSQEMDNTFRGATFSIDLQADAVQSKNNPLGGSSYAALWNP